MVATEAGMIARDGRTIDGRRHAPLPASEHRRLRRGYKLHDYAVAWMFLLPMAILFAIFKVLPLLGAFWLSTRSGGLIGGTEFVGLDNWASILDRSEIMRAIQVTFKLALIGVPITVVLALGVALLLQRVKTGASVFRFLLYFPCLVPGIIAGLVWIFIAHPDFGLLNQILVSFGLPPQTWLGPDLALPMVAAVGVWGSVGYWAIFFLAALIGLPGELYEAAHLDGAGAWQRLRHLTLPLLKPILILVIVMSTIWALQSFDSAYGLTRGGPGSLTTTIVMFIYSDVFESDRIGYAAALAIVLLFIIMVLVAVQMRLMRQRGA
jgi:multiple sugar transport system permease protein